MDADYGNLYVGPIEATIKREPVTVTFHLDHIGYSGLKELVFISGDEKIVLSRELILEFIRQLSEGKFK